MELHLHAHPSRGRIPASFLTIKLHERLESLDKSLTLSRSWKSLTYSMTWPESPFRTPRSSFWNRNGENVQNVAFYKWFQSPRCRLLWFESAERGVMFPRICYFQLTNLCKVWSGAGNMRSGKSNTCVRKCCVVGGDATKRSIFTSPLEGGSRVHDSLVTPVNPK